MVEAHPRPQRWLDPPDSNFLLDPHASKGARGLRAESPHFYCQYHPMSPSSLSPLIGSSRAKASGQLLHASMSNWKHWQRKITLLQSPCSTSPSCDALGLLHISTNEACPHHHGEQLLLRRFVKRKRNGKMGPSLNDDAQKETSTDEQTVDKQLSAAWRIVPTGIMAHYGHTYEYNDNNEDDDNDDDYHNDGSDGCSHADDGQAKPLPSSSVRGALRGPISNIEGLSLSLASSPSSSPTSSASLLPVPSNFTTSSTSCYTSHLPLVRTSAFEITAPTPSVTSIDGAALSFPNLGIKKNTHSSAASNSSSSFCSSSSFSYYSTSSPSSSFLNPRGNNILSESLPEPVTPSSKRHHAKPSGQQHIHLRSCRWIAIIVVQWLRWLFHVFTPLPHLFIPQQTWQELASSVLCDVTNNCSRVKKLCWWCWMGWPSSPSDCFAFSMPFSASTPVGWISLVRPWPSLCRGCMRTNPTQRKALSSCPSQRPSRMLPRTRHRVPLAPSSGGWTSTMFALGVLLLVHLVVVDSAKIGSFQCGYGVSASLACLPKDYSKFELPMKTGVNEISVSIHIDEVLRINDKDYSITFACYFNVKWPDKRIRLDQDFGLEQAGPGVNVTNNPNILVPMSLEMVKDLWLPNIFIYNIKTYKVIDVLNKLAGLWIGTDKSVMYSQATHITFICPMRFDKFPLDTQTCKFQVGSYSYDDSKMTFETEVAAYSEPKTSNSIALDYAITINKLKRSDQVFLGGPLGNFSLAGFEMVLHRYVSTYIITYYLPSGLFVIVSWISFLIPMDVIPGRMALLVTLFLVLVNIFNTVTTNTPKAEGLTAIEAWMLACILFVFGALIEYAAILFKKQRYVSSQHRLNIKIVCKDNFKYEVQERAATSAVSLQQLAEEYWRIDKFFLISFPILFFIFNIIYWLAFIL